MNIKEAAEERCENIKEKMLKERNGETTAHNFTKHRNKKISKRVSEQITKKKKRNI